MQINTDQPRQRLPGGPDPDIWDHPPGDVWRVKIPWERERTEALVPDTVAAPYITDPGRLRLLNPDAVELDGEAWAPLDSYILDMDSGSVKF